MDEITSEVIANAFWSILTRCTIETTKQKIPEAIQSKATISGVGCGLIRTSNIQIKIITQKLIRVE